MVKLFSGGVYLLDGVNIVAQDEYESSPGHSRAGRDAAVKGTIAYSIMSAHNKSGDMDNLRIRFDAMTSHDITYVGIVQTARASGMTSFPMPYVLTNCHNSLCAVGGTINEDDHLFGLSAAKKYGGIFVPPHIAVMHQYMREKMAGCGKMILGSDSHTRYGALGTMAIGEGGGELVKQLLNDTYDVARPPVIAVYLEGKPSGGVGPHDVALAIIGAVFKNGFVKNKVLEFVGPGVSSMDSDYRNSVDVMTTETACLSSVWRTDGDTKAYLEAHGRADDYRELNPAPVAYYDGMVRLDLSAVRPMIALPFHPSNVYTIDELNENPGDILRETQRHAQQEGVAVPRLTDKVINGKLRVEQGIIAGCAGGNYCNVAAAAHILESRACDSENFTLSVYPSSQPVYLDLVNKGMVGTLMQAGAVIKTAFCGPCFGAGDTPANGALSIRHTTRNFPNREGSKPGQGQTAAVALMDARSIAATAAMGGVLTGADKFADSYEAPAHSYSDTVYERRVYNGFGKAELDFSLVYGPNIKDWPEMDALSDDILLRVCAKIMDDVTTTDELIPSGETSSYRSNPLGLAEYTLSRRCPDYVSRAKASQADEKARKSGKSSGGEYANAVKALLDAGLSGADKAQSGSVIYAVRPGDGSAREQAASCQRVLGGVANIAKEYATKRYRSNVMNWGMLPFLLDEQPPFEVGDYVYVPAVRCALEKDAHELDAYAVSAAGAVTKMTLRLAPTTAQEREIMLAGCLINFNRNRKKQ